jgi:glycopeptide antibiotics resistance protein
LLSFLGFISYYKSHRNLIVSYFFLISIFFELVHIIIPNRSFQFSDLFGNIAGVLFSLILINIWRRK